MNRQEDFENQTVKPKKSNVILFVHACKSPKPIYKDYFVSLLADPGKAKSVIEDLGYSFVSYRVEIALIFNKLNRNEITPDQAFNHLKNLIK